MCDNGGECRNVQWLGYVCDNEFVVKADSGALMLETTEGDAVDPSTVTLKQGVTYRFSVEANSTFVYAYGSADLSAPPLQLAGNDCGCASNGPLLITIDNSLSGLSELLLRSDIPKSPTLSLAVEAIPVSPNNDEEYEITVVSTAAEAEATSAAYMYSLVFLCSVLVGLGAAFF
jgi:hypothetical protein